MIVSVLLLTHCVISLSCDYVTMCNKNKKIMVNTNNIKELFLKLDPSAKDEVRKKISEKFSVSVDTVRNHWIYNDNTPDVHKVAVIEILKDVANKKLQELKELIDVI